MQQMQDIGDDELRELERKSNPSSQNNNKDIADEDLIAMVQKIKEGKIPVVGEKVDTPKQMNNNFNQPIQNITNANYWKIEGLPSGGKFYPEGTEILGRPMKVLEVKKISSMGEENGDFVINDIIRRTITGIDVSELYTADKLYIVFWLRANTYRDSGYVVPFICPKCEKKSEYHFEVDNLEVQTLSEDFSPSKELKMSDGSKVTFDYLKIKDELFIDRFKELNYQTVGEIDDELLSMAQMIKTINGKDKTLLEKYHWILGVDPGDYSYLKSYMTKKGMGIKPFVNIECQECGGTASIAVSFREDFIVPEFKFE